MRILLILCLFLSIAVLSTPARAQVTYDNSNYSNCSPVPCSSLTYSLTVGAGSNRQLIVWTFVSTSTSFTVPYVASVTYNGVSLIPIAANGFIFHPLRSELWALPAGTQPATGAHNVVVAMSGSTGVDSLHSGAMSVAGVDQTQTFTWAEITSAGGGAVTQGVGSSYSSSVAIPYTNSNDLVFEAVCAGTSTDSTSQTLRFNNAVSGGTNCDNNALSTAAGGTTYMSWAVNGGATNGDQWVAVSGSLRAAATATKLQLKGGKLQVVADSGTSTPVTPFNWVQYNVSDLNDGSNTNTNTVTMNSSTTTGNTMICVTYVGANDAVSTMTDSQSNTYHKAAGIWDATDATDMELWYASGIAGGSNFTVTATWASATTTFRTVHCHEYAGLLASNAFDQYAVDAHPGVIDETKALGPVTTGYDHEMVFYATINGGRCNMNDNWRAAYYSDVHCDFIQYTAGQTGALFHNPQGAPTAGAMATFRLSSAKAQVK